MYAMFLSTALLGQITILDVFASFSAHTHFFLMQTDIFGIFGNSGSSVLVHNLE